MTIRSRPCRRTTARIWGLLSDHGTHVPSVGGRGRHRDRQGQVSRLCRWHDCSTLVNPMTLAGHVRGGVAQGIGTALYECYHYDQQGQLLTASFMDHLIPTLHELPRRSSSAMSKPPRRSPNTASKAATSAAGWSTADGRKVLADALDRWV